MKVRGISKHSSLATTLAYLVTKIVTYLVTKVVTYLVTKVIPAIKSFVAHDQVGRLGVHGQSLFILQSSNNEEIKKLLKYLFIENKAWNNFFLKEFLFLSV